MEVPRSAVAEGSKLEGAESAAIAALGSSSAVVLRARRLPAPTPVVELEQEELLEQRRALDAAGREEEPLEPWSLTALPGRFKLEAGAVDPCQSVEEQSSRINRFASSHAWVTLP
jgi:hypothetical protein